MEFGTREILILLGIVILLGILLDGIRRVRQARNGSLRVSRRKPAIFDDESYDDLPGELPTGEVRVTRRDEQSVEQVSDNIRKYRERNADKCTSVFLDASKNVETVVHHTNGASVQVDHSIQRAVDSSTAASTDFETPISDVAEHSIPADTDLDTDTTPGPEDTPYGDNIAADEGYISGYDSEDSPDEEIRVSLDEFAVDDDMETSAEDPMLEDRREPTWDMPEPEHKQAVREEKSEPFVVEPDPEKFRAKPARKPFWESAERAGAEEHEPSAASSDTASSSPPSRQRVEPAPARPSDHSKSVQSSAPSPDELQVVVMHIMARKDNQFEGARLLDTLLANGLRFGDMGIFHRHQYEDGSGPVHFSVANSVKPGTFNLDAMDDFQTPGITLFMNLEGLANALDSYSVMIKTAQAIAKSLQGELKDENRSALTKQTIEHYRQQIIEYTRRSFTLSS